MGNTGKILLILALFLAPSHAYAKRVALVIGNSAYEKVPELANPRNDAEAVAASLQRLGFEVILGVDLNRPAFEEKVRSFSRSIHGADIALFFYAGHGLQVNGHNYLAPVDTELVYETDLEFETIRLDLIMGQMERDERTNLIFLDACRNNPLARNLARSMGTRAASVGRGLAPVESGIGTLISFSTQPGNVALDGDGLNSPFTEALIEHIETPGEDIDVLLRRVRQEVIVRTGGRQVPWSNSSLTGPVILKKSSPEDNNSGTSAEIVFWNSIKDSDLVPYYQAYLQKYPDGEFAPLAKVKIKLIEEQKTLVRREQVPEKVSLPTSLGSAADPKNSTVASTSVDLSESNKISPVELDSDKRKTVQMALAQLGYDPGPADGQFGPRTRSAIRKARDSLGLPAGEDVDTALLNQLPDLVHLEALLSNDARKYSLSDIPQNADARLKKAIGTLSQYELKFAYYEGRLYIAVLSWGLDWNAAKALSERAGGHLVTISDTAENEFVYRLFMEDDRFVRQTSDGQKQGPWIGLFQQADGREPRSGWVWVNDEKVKFSNWSQGQPNNYAGNQEYAAFHSYGQLEPGRDQRPKYWDDYDRNGGVRGFIVEIESPNQ